MEINDSVYFTQNINEEVLLELINSKPLQRLKGICQHGASQYITSRKVVTRFDHSLGVMFLLKKLNALMEEQIAGLLHDVSHTAFSHVVDFLFKSENHDYHEKFYEKIILNSEIPNILEKHGFNLKRILNEKNFSLLEKNSPDLCADRIDYTLRDLVANFGFSKNITNYIENFVVKNNEIIFKDKIIAKNFGKDFLILDKIELSNPLELATYSILADSLKIALEKEIIFEEDLFTGDSFVFNKLKNSKDEKILEKIRMLNPNLKIVQDEKNYDYFIQNKLRFVDPKFVENGLIKKSSEEFTDFKDKLIEHEKLIKKGFFVRIVSY